MKLGAGVVVCLAALTAARSALGADEGRFDAQVFRPLAAPRDLVMVPKSEVIGHLSPVVGLYWDASLDPLALVIGDTNRTLDVIGARTQVTPLLGVGLFDWAEVTAAVPLVVWQTSDNLRSLGTEGRVASSPRLGDVRLSTKVALPFLNRKADVKSGFGMALMGNINLPTGDELAFTSDGGLSGGAQIIADYRFNFGLLLASNLGVWIRPEHQFAGVKVGDMAQFGVAAEMYAVQRWGLSVIGEVYGYPSLTSFPDSAAQVPAEVLLGVRWQTRQGITVSVGGSFGAACGFGAPAFRMWNSITWQPKSSAEQREINRILEKDSLDPDHDSVLSPADKCPEEPGVIENGGCPDLDRDHDGVIDRDDPCPDDATGFQGSDGCPLAYVDGDTIKISEPITFEPGSDEPTSSAHDIVRAVVAVILNTPTIREVVVEVHTDAREADAESFVRSDQRAERIGQIMLDDGLEVGRVFSRGHGHRNPLYFDADCVAPDEELSPICLEVTRRNRRVEFRVQRWGAPVPREILGPNPASVLPLRLLKDTGASAKLPVCRPWMKGDKEPIPCVLPTKPAVLQQGHILESAKNADGMLPKGGSQLLPHEGVLPTGAEPLNRDPE